MEIDVAAVVLHQHAAGERTCPGLDPEKALEALDHPPGDARVAIQAAHGDSGPPVKAFGFVLQDRRKWLILRQFRGVLHRGVQGVQEGRWVRHGWIEMNQDISCERVRIDSPDSRQLMDLFLDVPASAPGPSG